MRRNYNKVATQGARDLEMMKQKPTLEQRALQILQVPSLSKPIQEAKPPPPTHSQSFHALTQASHLRGEVKFETG